MKKQNYFFSIFKNRILIFLLVIVSIITSFGLPSSSVFASNKYPYDEYNVLDDLSSVREFNVKDYPASQTKTPAIISFVEWCYSVKNPGDFALYLYFYNPQQWDISAEDEGNVATMAIAYDENGAPTSYESFKLIFCNRSEDKLFYKFRIEDHDSADRNNIESRVDPNLRRYDISALTFGITNVGAKTVAVGACYKFSGFAKGYGDGDVSTLKSEGVTRTETLRLYVNHTNYRTAGSSLGENHQVDVNSVYFSVPEKYFTEYGNLQSIKAEWYEYKLKPMMIFQEQEYYDEIAPYLGVNIGYNTEGIDNGYYEEGSLTLNSGSGFTYNVPQKLLSESNASVINTLYLGFVSEDGKVDKGLVESAVKGYNKTYDKGALNLGGTKYSLDIFEDSVDEGRTMGYNVKEIDAGDTFNLLNFSDDMKPLWRKLFGLHDYTERNDVSPIESNISSTVMSYSDEKLSEELLINVDDVDVFRDFYNKAKKNNERTVLFRFAQTDYFSKLATRTTNINGFMGTKHNDVWFSYETVFLNFRIITLKFAKAEKATVIPVAQDPIDIINGLTVHPNDEPITWDDVKDALGIEDDGESLLMAIIVLVSTIFIGAGILLLALVFVVKISEIKSTALKVFLYILIAIALGVIFYFGLSYAIELIRGYGGLKIK